MKKLLAVVLLAFIASPVLAEKPADKGGKGKPGMEHKQGYKMDKASKKGMGDEYKDKAKDDYKDKAKKEKADKEDKLTGLDKQKEMKAEQERKELGKGSEQGQASREQHSKKWWKFWE